MSGLALIGYLMIFSLMVIIITKKMSAFSGTDFDSPGLWYHRLYL